MKPAQIHIYIEGMTCPACRSRIEKAVRGIEGVRSAKVSLSERDALISCVPGSVTIDDIRSAVEPLGYTVLTRKPLGRTARMLLLLSIMLALFILLDRLGILNLLAPSALADSGMSYGALFVVGLVTSVHCVAMCGGINLSQCLTKHGAARADMFLPAFLYNAGRICSYGLIGAALGLIGMLIGGTSGGIPTLAQGILKIAAGIFMVLFGLVMLGLIDPPRLNIPHMPALRGGGGRLRPFIVGLLNGLMPCGPLQAMQLAALASGDPLTGALSMLMFGLGTLPLMLGLGSVISVLGRKFTRTVTTIGAMLVAVLGLAMLSQGGNLSGLFDFPILLTVSAALSLAGIVSTLRFGHPAMRLCCMILSACAVIAVLPISSALSVRSVEETEIIDGVQIVRSTLQPGDYPDITVQAGMPVKWYIDAPEGSVNGCNYRMYIREYGIEHTFSTGENLIEFTPERTGDFTYSCWMGMIYGAIRVTE